MEQPISIDFGLLDYVNDIITRNVYNKAMILFDEVEDHISGTNLHAMAEFDGGHDLNMVEEQMSTQLLHKADIEPEWHNMSEGDFHALWCESSMGY